MCLFSCIFYYSTSIHNTKNATWCYKIRGYVSLTFSWVYGTIFALIKTLAEVTGVISAAKFCNYFEVDHISLTICSLVLRETAFTRVLESIVLGTKLLKSLDNHEKSKLFGFACRRFVTTSKNPLKL